MLRGPRWSSLEKFVVEYLDFAVLDLDIILGQRIESGEILDIPSLKAEARPVPRAGDDPLAKGPVDQVGPVVGALVAHGVQLTVLPGHQTRHLLGQGKLFLKRNKSTPGCLLEIGQVLKLGAISCLLEEIATD